MMTKGAIAAHVCPQSFAVGLLNLNAGNNVEAGLMKSKVETSGS